MQALLNMKVCGPLPWPVALIVMLLASQTVLAATTDTATQGNWVGVYGADGFILPNYAGVQAAVVSNAAMNAKTNDKFSLPSWISDYNYGTSGQGFVWDSTTLDVRAPQDPDNPAGNRVANTVFDGDYSINLTLSEATEFQLGVYGLDWDSTARDIAVTVNGETVDFDNAANDYNQGIWGLWMIDAPAGLLSINIDLQAGGNSTISAITFDAVQQVPEPASIAIWCLLAAAGIGYYCRRSRR